MLFSKGKDCSLERNLRMAATNSNTEVTMSMYPPIPRPQRTSAVSPLSGR